MTMIEGYTGYWIISENVWICLIMPEYSRVHMNMGKCAWIVFDLNFSIVILCLFKRRVTYFNGVHSLKSMRSFSWRDKKSIFCMAAGSIWFVFFYLDRTLSQVKFEICCYLWRLTEPGAVDLDIPRFWCFMALFW